MYKTTSVVTKSVVKFCGQIVLGAQHETPPAYTRTPLPGFCTALGSAATTGSCSSSRRSPSSA